MGQLTNIPDLVRKHYETVGGYFKGLTGFLGDPESPNQDAAQAITGVDLSDMRRAIQSRVNGSASTTNAALLASYRDLDSVSSEMALRSMTRAEYYREAATEAGIRQANWQGNLQNNLFNLTGTRQAPKDN